MNESDPCLNVCLKMDENHGNMGQSLLKHPVHHGAYCAYLQQ